MSHGIVGRQKAGLTLNPPGSAGRPCRDHDPGTDCDSVRSCLSAGPQDSGRVITIKESVGLIPNAGLHASATSFDVHFLTQKSDRVGESYHRFTAAVSLLSMSVIETS